jgi:hypothetical protein
MTLDLTDHLRQEEDGQKRRTELIKQEFEPEPENLCEHCGGPLEESMTAIPEFDSVEYDWLCKNPDCPSRESD